MLRAYVGDLSYEWNTVGEFLDKMEQAPISVNFGTEVGHGSIRVAAMGFENRKPTSGEMETMRALLREALEDGAPIYRIPDDTVEAFGRFLGDYVIGVYGDDWVIAMTWYGDICYVRRAHLWAGNG